MNLLAIALTLPVLMSVAPARLHAEAANPPTPVHATPPLVIRTYTVQASDEPSPATRALASSLLAEAGIQSRWTICGTQRASALCAQPLGATELAMRLVHGHSGPAEGDRVAMGTSLVDTARRTGVLATLYLDRIDSLATSSGTHPSVILARAIAHEAAHLVLGTNDHGSAGLMRALWSREMLRREPTSEWVFTSGERQRLREALAERR